MSEKAVLPSVPNPLASDFPSPPLPRVLEDLPSQPIPLAAVGDDLPIPPFPGGAENLPTVPIPDLFF